MKIGILQTGHVLDVLLEKHGDFSDMFKSLLDGQGFEFITYNVVDNQFPETIQDADGWLITGSAHAAYEDHPWISRLEEFLRQSYDSDIPIVGICFGHQILAKALGGKVEKFREGWSIGNQSYALPGKSSESNVIAWHQDQVVTLPDDATQTGTSEFCENAFVTYGNKAYTMQAHPEFTTEFGRDLTKLRKAKLPENLVADAETGFSKRLDTHLMAERIAKFFKTRQAE